MDADDRFRPAWAWAGVCGIASGLLTLQSRGGVVPLWTSAGLMAVALLLVAFVGGPHRNIVRGDMVGTVALALWALWMLVRAVLPDLGGTVPGPAVDIIGIAFAFVATVMIGRSGGFTSRWRWAPLVMLGILAVVWVGVQVVMIATVGSVDQATLGTMIGVLNLVLAAWPVALGVLAILAGNGLGRAPASVTDAATSAAERG